MDHVISECRRHRQSEAFQSYVADVLKGIANTNVKYFSRDNNAELVQRRLYDILHPQINDKTGDDIAKDVLKRAGLKIGN